MSDTILSGLIEKALRPDNGNWACRDWKTVSELLDAAGEHASDMVMDLIGLLVDRGEEQAAEIDRLAAELAEAKARIAWLEEYSDMADRRAAQADADLTQEQQRTAEAREAARTICQHVTDYDTAMSYSARWPWLEETR